MKKSILLTFYLSVATMLGSTAQVLKLTDAKFQKGDNMEWKNTTFDDSRWKSLSMLKPWTDQGISNPNNYAWYRIRFTLPESMLDNSDIKETVLFVMGKIDDADETYLNGVLIGKTGSTPGDKEGYVSKWEEPRTYSVSASNKAIRWGKENVLAVRVYNGNDPGGMFGSGVSVSVPSRIDGMKAVFVQKSSGDNPVCTATIKNTNKSSVRLILNIDVTDTENGQSLRHINKKLTVKGNGAKPFDLAYSKGKCVQIKVTCTDATTGKKAVFSYIPKYILTPPAPATPRYNGPLVYGVRPGSPVIFRIPVSGERPMKFSVNNLPEGLTLDKANGVISGSIRERGDYEMTIVAENAKGKTEQPFTIKVGDKIALTPPMGWNSWNCWGLSVSQEKVMSSARALIEKGLADYGYSYINVDDAWEAPQRNADGTIAVNEKFPDMKGLGDWLHSNGLKFGIYSSPGDRTCGNYLGSLGHEEQDAKTYNSWGIDYLKYDWCGYSREFDKSTDRSLAAYARPYMHMQKYLREQPRDIFYSLCQYGMADVWKWGPVVDANSWRTTGDITDTWESLYDIGFVRQADLHPYAAPGHWNDPDMLIVGMVGWSDNLRDTRLTPDEQYTHISLWSLLASNMLIGCDISRIDDFTLALLCNNEVNAVNQDILGKQAKREVSDGDIQIWKRPLADGSYAVGIFNLGDSDATVDFSSYFGKLGIGSLTYARDLWRQKDISTSDTRYFIPSHGVKFIRIKY